MDKDYLTLKRASAIFSHRAGGVGSHSPPITIDASRRSD